MTTNLATTPLMTPRHLPVVGSGAPMRRLRFANDGNADGTPGAAGEQSGDGTGGGDYKPPASQADLDLLIEKRLTRERAKYSDYDTLREKASKFDAAERDNKPADQRAADDVVAATQRAERAEAELAKATLQALKAEVAANKGIPLALLQGDTREALEAHADALAEFRGEQPKDRSKPGPRVPNVGNDRDGSPKEKSVDAGRELYAESRKKK